MRSLSLLVFATLCDLSFQTQAAGFRSPGYIGNRKVDPLAAVEVWRIGEPRMVVFDAPWTEYSVELWQSAGAEHVNQTAQNVVYEHPSDADLSALELLGQKLPTTFNWTVEPYDLKLSDSNMFFFWLRVPSDTSRSATSPYFNMTTNSSAATPNTFFSYASIDKSPGTPTVPPVRTTPTSPARSPTSSPAQGDGRKSLAIQVAIAVGISVGGICSFVCAAILCVHLRKKVSLKRAGKDSDRESVSSLPWPPTPKFSSSETWGLPKPPPSSSPLVKQSELPLGCVQPQSQTRSSVLSDKKAKRYELDGHPRVASSVYSR
ncbi:hypothetical protein PG994_013128 [Apiospora phragmitis]|uniref:Mid2 domain-containing protein n=1 Tax=Apiospora phragmitis TaxID=2905665 RepID=A0ABR1T7R8_9PEZI